jgi:D-amino-acid dehydrogenase
MKVAIVGAGVIGLHAAYYLQKAGFTVTVLEQTNGSDACSYGNMGYVSPSHFIPLATPGIIKQGLKWMMSSNSPFYIKPRLNMDLFKWGMHFWKSANANNVEKNAPHLNNLLQLSKSLTVDLKNELPSAFELFEKGVWMLYKNESTKKHEIELAKQANNYGLKTIVCDKAAVQSYEKNTEVNVLGGVLYTDDCHVNPTQLMNVLKTHLIAQGVQIINNAFVTSFDMVNNQVSSIAFNNQKINIDAVVIANGSWMQQTAKLLHANIPLQPGKGYSMQYNDVVNNILYPSILVDDRVATTPINNWLRIGGTMELSGHSTSKLPNRYLSIYKAFKNYYPALKIDEPTNDDIWYGYRPVSPDGMPYIGKHNNYSNVVFAGGHAMLGISAAAGTGKLVAQLLLNNTTSIAIDAFLPQRF